MALTQCVCSYAKDRLEDTHEWIRQLILEVIFGINRDVVLQNEDGVLRFLVRGGT